MDNYLYLLTCIVKRVFNYIIERLFNYFQRNKKRPHKESRVTMNCCFENGDGWSRVNISFERTSSEDIDNDSMDKSDH